MKFGKSLSNQIDETLPEWGDKFLAYKELKKRLKLIDPKTTTTTTTGGDGDVQRSNKRLRTAADEEDCFFHGEKEMIGMTREEIDFIGLLDAELDKFNWFFEEKQEEYIIRLRELQGRVAKAKESDDELIRARREIVDFHGEMVLLENYSALNYTGLVKILKKYDKRTGALIRLSFIQKVLQQPFVTTDLLYDLVKECEVMLDRLFPTNEPSVPTEADVEEKDCTTTAISKKENLLKGPTKLEDIEYIESLYMKSTVSALRSLKEIRSGSSTVSVFSLPPMKSTGSEEPK